MVCFRLNGKFCFRGGITCHFATVMANAGLSRSEIVSEVDRAVDMLIANGVNEIDESSVMSTVQYNRGRDLPVPSSSDDTSFGNRDSPPRDDDLYNQEYDSGWVSRGQSDRYKTEFFEFDDASQY